MNDLIYYKAFGLILESEFPIVQLPTVTGREPDVRIIRADLSALPRRKQLYSGPDGCYFRGQDLCIHRITGGNLIELDPREDYDLSKLGVYLMGTCMGAIHYQRELMMLHGSCVTDGCRSILLTGDSGAGKSTLAAEFLLRGWKLITDDVSVVYDPEGLPVIQSSYPSQKLWQDALARYDRPEDDIHSLYTTGNREKYGVDVTSHFYDGRAPLSLIVRLLPHEEVCSIRPVEGMTKVDQLMRNTYRRELIEQSRLQLHFQRCVTLATKVPMAAITRIDGEDCAGRMYDLITEHMSGLH